MSSYVLRFRNIDSTFLPLVGGKGANLGEMTQAGFPVPDGFCISTRAYQEFIAKGSNLVSFFHELTDVRYNDLETIGAIASKIREHLISLPFPEAIQEEVLAAWEEIGKEKSYAVRSSATAEDLPTASFAGQQDTYLNVIGEDQLLESVKSCWASLFTDRAVSYRIKNNFPHDVVLLSVVVQEMVFSDVSGIMFTADPVSGKRNSISINASFGLGEALVGGLVKSDLYQVENGEIIKKEIAEKKIQITSEEGGGTREYEITKEQRALPSLSDAQVLELSELGRRIEAHYKKEQDIEWCLKDGEFFIVQSRPITSLYPLPDKPTPGLHFFFSVGHLQMMTEAMKPLGLSVFLSFSQYVQEIFSLKNPPLVIAGNRLYIDLVVLLEYKIFQKILPELLPSIDESGARILENFMKKEDFQKILGKNISPRKVWTIFTFFIQELWLFAFGRFENIFENVSTAIESELTFYKKELSNIPSLEKISKIKALLPTFPQKVVYETGIVKYMPLAIGSYKLLGLLSKKWLGDTNEVDAIGKAPLGNVTTEMGLMFGDIADSMRTSPGVQTYLKQATDRNFWEGLERVVGGGNTKNLLKIFFEIYGARGTGEIDITRPRWSENPTQIIPLILSGLGGEKPGQHRKDFQYAQQESEEASVKILERLRQKPFGSLKRMIMKRLIYVHRSTIGIREHPKFVIINIFWYIKQSILEEAEKFASEHILEEKEDIFYFSLDEISEMLRTKRVDTVLLKSRKENHHRNQDLRPPRVFTGDGEILSAKKDIHVPIGSLVGTAASAGIVEGRARVIKSLGEANLERGDILVTTYTDPAWTPLFVLASGVVTEVGGLLTHGAVVAREYGIPAVVGVDDATTKIPDGAHIRVNGMEGYIQIIK